jgi:hypothetical protein
LTSIVFSLSVAVMVEAAVEEIAIKKLLIWQPQLHKVAVQP